jgi:hypothetical protein
MDLVLPAFSLFEHRLGLLAVGDIFDRNENRVTSAVGRKAARVEEHIPAVVFDGRRAIVDGALAAVLRD